MVGDRFIYLSLIIFILWEQRMTRILKIILGLTFGFSIMFCPVAIPLILGFLIVDVYEKEDD